MSEESQSRSNKFFEKLIHEDGLGFASSAILYRNFTDSPPPLKMLLGLSGEHYSNIANEAIAALDEQNEAEWVKFKWKLWAFYELQDVFDMTIHNHFEDMAYFRSWYFYYESKYVLMESILTGLNGFYHSSGIVLRPFLEFSVLQNYYYLNSKNSSSYLEVNKCLQTGIYPKWGRIIKGSMPKNTFAEPIKYRIDAHYRALSDHYSHPHSQEFSPKLTNSSSTPKHTILGVLSFWRHIDFVLESVLWMYYTNFPMIFHPKPLQKKFGYNGPVGLFVDTSQAYIFRNSLREKDLEAFENISNSNEDVKALCDWFEGHNDLTVEEIAATWNVEEDGELNFDSQIAQIKKTDKMRALREAMSINKKTEEDDDLDFSKVDLSLSGWSKVKKRLKK